MAEIKGPYVSTGTVTAGTSAQVWSTCQRCHTLTGPLQNFCSACGLQLRTHCQTCGQPLPEPAAGKNG